MPKAVFDTDGHITYAELTPADVYAAVLSKDLTVANKAIDDEEARRQQEDVDESAPYHEVGDSIRSAAHAQRNLAVMYHEGLVDAEYLKGAVDAMGGVSLDDIYSSMSEERRAEALTEIRSVTAEVSRVQEDMKDYKSPEMPEARDLTQDAANRYMRDALRAEAESKAVDKVLGDESRVSSPEIDRVLGEMKNTAGESQNTAMERLAVMHHDAKEQGYALDTTNVSKYGTEHTAQYAHMSEEQIDVSRAEINHGIEDRATINDWTPRHVQGQPESAAEYYAQRLQEDVVISQQKMQNSELSDVDKYLAADSQRFAMDKLVLMEQEGLIQSKTVDSALESVGKDSRDEYLQDVNTQFIENRRGDIDRELSHIVHGHPDLMTAQERDWSDEHGGMLRDFADSNTQEIEGRWCMQQNDGLWREIPADGQAAKTEQMSKYAMGQDGTVYHVIEDPAAYIDQLRENGAPEVTSEKTGSIMVRRAVEGEEIKTWTSDGKLETTNVGKEGAWVVTRVGDDGKPVIDEHGHENTWQVDAATLAKKYAMPEGGIDALQDGQVVKPAGGPQHFVEVDKNVAIMTNWGELQMLKEGSVLNATNKSDVYGIAKPEFDATYAPVKFEDLYAASMNKHLTEAIAAKDANERVLNSDDYWANFDHGSAGWDGLGKGTPSGPQATIDSEKQKIESYAKESVIAHERGLLTDTEFDHIREVVPKDVVPDFDKMQYDLSRDESAREQIGFQIDAQLDRIARENPGAVYRENPNPQADSQQADTQSEAPQSQSAGKTLEKSEASKETPNFDAFGPIDRDVMARQPDAVLKGAYAQTYDFATDPTVQTNLPDLAAQCSENHHMIGSYLETERGMSKDELKELTDAITGDRKQVSEDLAKHPTKDDAAAAREAQAAQEAQAKAAELEQALNTARDLQSDNGLSNNGMGLG